VDFEPAALPIDGMADFIIGAGHRFLGLRDELISADNGPCFDENVGLDVIRIDLLFAAHEHEHEKKEGETSLL
jgi:hypothetical protein